MVRDQMEPKIRVLELFAGIGGLHWALKVSRTPCEVVAAMEINPIVLETYIHNFGDANVTRKNLEGLTASEINEIGIDAIVMSPPCQPFCRTGNRLDTDDKRTGPLTRITEFLPEVRFKYIFVENVQGFEVSSARDSLLKALRKLNFTWQEFMLTPRTVGVPNSRLRYYLIGKSADLPWSFSVNSECILSEVPNWSSPERMPFKDLKQEYDMIASSRHKRWKEQRRSSEGDVNCLGGVLEWELSQEDIAKLKVPESVIGKYFQAMDIVTPLSVNTCCFTKGYGHFVKGTGSVLNYNDDSTQISEGIESHNHCSNSKEGAMHLRYFSPREISRLMSYPEEFEFPKHLSLNQKYRSLGNSVNVYVVGILFTLLFFDDVTQNKTESR